MGGALFLSSVAAWHRRDLRREAGADFESAWRVFLSKRTEGRFSDVA